MQELCRIHGLSLNLLTDVLLLSDSEVISLLAKLVGIQIPNFSDIANRGYGFSQMLANNLALKIINQQRLHQPNDNTSKVISKIKLTKQKHN